MIAIETLLDAYLDINILLIVTALLWGAAQMGIRAAGLAHTYSAQVRLLQWMLLAVLLSPLIVAGLAAGLGGATPNLSDFIVAQYLRGSFEMNPSSLEAMLGLQHRTVTELTALDSTAGQGALAALLAGFALFAGRLGLAMLRLGRILRRSHPWRRFGTLHLRLCDTACVPFSTRTLTRRIVVIPSSLLADHESLKIVLAHELQHFRQNDIGWEIGLQALRPLFFWNPAYYLVKRQIEGLRELACDQRLLARGRIRTRAYCRCLLRISATSLRPARLFAVEPPQVAFVQMARAALLPIGRRRRTAPALRRRIAALIDGRIERRPGRMAAVLAVPLLALTLLASVAIQKPTDWSQDRIMLSTIVNLERLAIRNSLAVVQPAGF